MSKYIILKDENSGNKIIASLPEDKSLTAGDVVMFRREETAHVGTSLCDSFTPATPEIEEYILDQFKQKECVVVGRYTEVESWETTADSETGENNTVENTEDPGTTDTGTTSEDTDGTGDGS